MKREMRKYPLTTLDPENFITTLEEIGGLSPYVEFKSDKKSKLLFALATEADHAKIKSLIADFDGTGRQFEVVWLRRLPADAVAATIFNLMAGQTKEKEDDNNRRVTGARGTITATTRKRKKPVQGLRRRRRHRKQPAAAVGERIGDGAGARTAGEVGRDSGRAAEPRPVRFVEPGGDVSDGGTAGEAARRVVGHRQQ